MDEEEREAVASALDSIYEGMCDVLAKFFANVIADYYEMRLCRHMWE